MEVVKNYYTFKNVDISKNMEAMERYSDGVSKNDKKISPYFAGTIIFIVILLIVLIFFNLTRISQIFI